MLFKASLKALILSATVLLPTALMAQGAPAEAPATEAPAETAAPAPVAAETAAPAEAPAAGDKETIAVENPYGIGALWAQGDFVAKGVLVLMLIMSGATWYIMIVKLIDQTKLFKQAKEANATFWTSKSVAEGLSKVKTGTPFWYIADRGVAASQHHEGTLVEQIDLSSWVTMSINRAVDEIQSKLQGGLAVLATVGSTAPFVGLFGTVWGIYHALTAIGISGQASIDKVAGPVGEALIMTAIGLAVAVPAVMGYNWLVRRNKAGMETVRSFSADLHSVLLSGTRVGNK
ncbi:MotA/TolQ/ExbB proton channel family protein [Hydrocarboniphaga effusa]|jgi:biopolymer transport protein ExbB|uniref:MotA/TolQ/ExbB proton channel family protein n=1 Tax=Hydrocarboniphaga effusa TaxID=243629 RepID=UPI0035B2F857